MNDKTYPRFYSHLLKPYLASPCFHQTSPSYHNINPTPLHHTTAHIVASYKFSMIDITRDADLDELHPYEDFQGLYEEYMGNDELAL
nr:hypothetical protein I308_05242 [Cryptococcus tetragattii IND107]